MKMKSMVILLFLGIAAPSWAFTCYYTLAKDNCWTDYNVSVDVTNSFTGAILTTVTVPKGQQWTRQAFDCEPAQKLMFTARFSPAFWQNDEGKTYSAQDFRALPNVINSSDSAWDVSMCYPSDFSLVPLPPQATGSCQCDFSAIPAIPPKKM